MSYTPYLIANYATGLEKRLQPWLIPDDAQEELLDGFVYRGTMSKRAGYRYFADGNRAGQPYTESRVVSTTTALVVAVGNGTTGPYVFVLPNTPIQRGTVAITAGAQIARDNGLGGFIAPATGFIDYSTGVVSVTFGAVVAAINITATFSIFPDQPVMGIMNFITATNIKQLLVATTTRLNLFNSTLNILQDITITPYTGTKFNFWSWVNYKDGLNNPRLIFTNNKDDVQYYAPAIVPITGSYVSYPGFFMLSDATVPVAITTLAALLAFEFKDRLLLLRTTENGAVKPQRIRISGTGEFSDDFRTSATGAGFIDIPDGTWIQGAAFNRDDLIIFTEASTWVLKYTGNDTTPFVLDKIDESRGSKAPFSAITYLNRTSAASPRGLIISDGYRVERQDESIPDFTFNEVDDANFELCFAGSVDKDRDHYLIYPPVDQIAGTEISQRILVTNYDEDNYSIYRIELSCMGTYENAFDITWNDLLKYNNWAEFAADYGDWNSFAFSTGAPNSIGGGHHGEVWLLNITGLEDNPVKIRNITIINATTVEVTTDWNNYDDNVTEDDLASDTIFITGVSGMVEINDGQYPIVVGSIVGHNVFRLTVPSTANFTPFNTNFIGEAIRVIPFTALFKKFNPYVDSDKKVRCGWLYMYVDSAGTDLQRNIAISAITNANPAVVTTILDHNLQTGNQVSFFGIGGMTQLNGAVAFIKVLSPTTFSLNGVDSTAFGAYTSGGYASVNVDAKMEIDIITNDVGHKTQLNNINPEPYQGTVTNLIFEDGAKKWYKVFINQTGRFIQFRFRNLQAGAKINIQATMPGFQPVGRLL